MNDPAWRREGWGLVAQGSFFAVLFLLCGTFLSAPDWARAMFFSMAGVVGVLVVRILWRLYDAGRK